MSKMYDIQKRIDEVMASVDNIRRAEPRPFFFTRLEARFTQARSNTWDRISKTISRPAVAFATLALVLLLNAAVVIQGLNAASSVPDFSEMASTEDLRSTTAYYDIENNQP